MILQIGPNVNVRALVYGSLMKRGCSNTFTHGDFRSLALPSKWAGRPPSEAMWPGYVFCSLALTYA